jgi:hypothetical protein
MKFIKTKGIETYIDNVILKIEYDRSERMYVESYYISKNKGGGEFLGSLMADLDLDKSFKKYCLDYKSGVYEIIILFDIKCEPYEVVNTNATDIDFKNCDILKIRKVDSSCLDDCKLINYESEDI